MEKGITEVWISPVSSEIDLNVHYTNRGTFNLTEGLINQKSHILSDKGLKISLCLCDELLNVLKMLRSLFSVHWKSYPVSILIFIISLVQI